MAQRGPEEMTEARSVALDTYLTQRGAQGFQVETRSGFQAVIVRRHPLHFALRWVAKDRAEQRFVISVDEHGRVVSVRLVQGLGYGLDEAALAAARSMTFAPAVRCGKPSAATFKIGINFSPP